jgi:membrane protein implicated in regulation of membrane protease activity
MNWADFYLICFAVGFAFSSFSFLLGGAHWHLPHGIGHVHAGPHVHIGHAAGHVAPGPAHVSFFNPASLAAFLAWFGGTGYLLTRFSGVWFVLGLIIALASGLVGASVVFLFFKKVLISEDENLDPADFDMVGVLGRLSMPIREQGTGELIYSQAGTRRTCGARAESGSAISKGTEVVVTRYEKGIAYVRPWTEMAGEEPVPEIDKANS